MKRGLNIYYSLVCVGTGQLKITVFSYVILITLVSLIIIPSGIHNLSFPHTPIFAVFSDCHEILWAEGDI